MAQDLLQEALLTGFTRFHQLRDAGAFRAWMAAIVRNTHLNRRSSTTHNPPFEPLTERAAVAAERTGAPYARERRLLAGVAVQITDDVARGSEQFLKIVQARSAGGMAAGADVARAEAKLAADRQELIEARNLRIRASTRLAVVLRRDVDTVLLPSDERLAPASFARPPVRDPQLRPDVQAADQRAAEAKRLVASAKWDLYFPELRAELGYLRIGDTTSDLEGRSERAALMSWNLSPVVLGRIRRRRAERHRARLELARARFNLARAIVEFNAAQARLLAASGTIGRASLLGPTP